MVGGTVCDFATYLSITDHQIGISKSGLTTLLHTLVVTLLHALKTGDGGEIPTHFTIHNYLVNQSLTSKVICIDQL